MEWLEEPMGVSPASSACPCVGAKCQGRDQAMEDLGICYTHIGPCSWLNQCIIYFGT